MENIKTFFFDTYALYEILHGSQSYSPYKKTNIMTTKLNLMELHFILLRTYGIEIAEKAFEKFNQFCIDITDEDIKQSNQLKLSINKRDVSYIDCLGYIIANKLGVKFLTGDKEFQDLDNVEFVK